MPKHTILVEISQNSQNGPADGPGPIYTCRRLVYSYRRDAAGNFRADFPATDTRLALITLKNTILRFYVGGELVFSGIVERIKKVMDRKGKQTVIITGRDDVLGMLAENIVGSLALSFAYDAPSQILGASNVTNRTLVMSGDGYSTTTYSYTKQFAGESALQALIKVAEDTGEHFRGATTGDPELIWMRTDTPAAPIRLVASGGPLLHENPDVAIIEDIESDKNGEKLYNRVYPYGAGNGAARLTLEHSTTTMPAGFSMDTVNNYVQYDDGQNLPSVQRSIRKLFNHIGIENSDTYSINVTTTATTGATLISVEAIALPIASGTLLDLNGGGVDFVELSASVSVGANVLNVVATGFDVLDTDTLVYTNPVAQEGAARQLTDAALAFLQRICNPDNLVSYKMTVRGLPDSIHVGMLIPVLSQAPGFEIDDDLIILEITRTVDRNGRTPAILTVVPVDWFDMGEAASVATAIEELRNYQAQTQPVDYATVTNPPTIPADFTDLGDVPASYTGAGGQFVKVNVGETALEFVTASGGAVDSVNGATGVVVLDADDIDDSATTHKFATATELTKLAGIEALADVTDAVNIASSIVGVAAKTTPVDADTLPLIDSAASNALKELSWANVKATLKAYFDTLYGLLATANTWVQNQTIASTQTTGNALRVIRNLAAASTDDAVAEIIQDNAGDDQPALVVQQDGTGAIVEAYDGATLVLRAADGGRLDVYNIIRALTASGLRLEDDGGNLGIFVEDSTGRVGIRKSSSLAGTLHAASEAASANRYTITADLNAGSDSHYANVAFYVPPATTGGNDQRTRTIGLFIESILADPNGLLVGNQNGTDSGHIAGIEIGSITTTAGNASDFDWANYGIWIKSLAGGAGTRHQYGIKIDDVSGAAETNYGLYIAGGSRNYFEGATYIGLPSGGANKLGVEAGTSSNDAAVGGVLYVTTTQTGNVGTGVDDLASYSVPANTLAVNGQSLWFEAYGTTPNNANTKAISVLFGSTTIATWNLTTSSENVWTIRGRITRTGAATEKAYTTILSRTVNGALIDAAVAETLSGALNLKVQGEATSNNDIILQGFTVGWDDANS